MVYPLTARNATIHEIVRIERQTSLSKELVHHSQYTTLGLLCWGSLTRGERGPNHDFPRLEHLIISSKPFRQFLVALCPHLCRSRGHVYGFFSKLRDLVAHFDQELHEDDLLATQQTMVIANSETA